MTPIFRALAAVLILVFSWPALAGQGEQRAQVMMMGIFHFANPGLDVVKTDDVNVMSDENQAYLEKLAASIAEFDPTVVLLEFEASNNDIFQERFRQYLAGEFELPSNEVYQLGFRIAAMSAAETVHGFDERGIEWNAEPLFEYLETVDIETKSRVDEKIEKVTAEMNARRATLPLRELLLTMNDPKSDRSNRSFYIQTNHVGEGDNFVGADAAASWWHRNFRMYALIQRHAQPGERVLVIGGQGHTAILRQLLEDDPDRDAVDVRPYL